MFGVRVGAAARAYPLPLLVEQPLIQDEINGTPVLVWFEAATETAVAFNRQLEGHTLTFTTDPDAPGRLQDEQTGTVRQAITGWGIDGRYRGAQLSPLIATTAFAFGWYGYFPHSSTYPATD